MFDGLETAFSKISGKFKDFFLHINLRIYLFYCDFYWNLYLSPPFSGGLKVLCYISILLLLRFNRHIRGFFSNQTLRLINIYVTEKNLNVLYFHRLLHHVLLPFQVQTKTNLDLVSHSFIISFYHNLVTFYCFLCSLFVTCHFHKIKNPREVLL